MSPVPGIASQLLFAVSRDSPLLPKTRVRIKSTAEPTSIHIHSLSTITR